MSRDFASGRMAQEDENHAIRDESAKKLTRLHGRHKDDTIDDEQIRRDLQELNRKSEEHLLSEWREMYKL